MPYYYISILLSNKKIITGVKEHPDNRIDQVFRIYLNEAVKHYKGSEIADFDCVMISKQSNKYREWMKKKQIKSGMIKDDWNLDFTPEPQITRKKYYRKESKK